MKEEERVALEPVPEGVGVEVRDVDTVTLVEREVLRVRVLLTVPVVLRVTLIECVSDLDRVLDTV